MTQKTAGIHHITAFAGSPQKNVDFYAGILGLRLIKRTVNYDAPDIYHLYFGNEKGSPGTAMTFFPSSRTRPGRIGGGQVGYTTFAAPAGSLSFWEKRLEKFGIPVEQNYRFGETSIRFRDWDGLQLEIVERTETPESQWSFGGVPQEKAIKGFAGAILFSTKPEGTMNLLEVLGFDRVNEDEEFVRFRSNGEYGNIIDVYKHAMERGSGGAGTIHHIAWRAQVQDQESWRNRVANHGYKPTEIIDRQYFQSIYFREHGGILFEIATDAPGFDIDEPMEQLGEKLMLPPWYEPRRIEIQSLLEPITLRVLEDDHE